MAHFAHPAQVTVPDDIEKIKAVGKAPFLISACETDQTVSTCTWLLDRSRVLPLS